MGGWAVFDNSLAQNGEIPAFAGMGKVRGMGKVGFAGLLPPPKNSRAQNREIPAFAGMEGGAGMGKVGFAGFLPPPKNSRAQNREIPAFAGMEGVGRRVRIELAMFLRMAYRSISPKTMSIVPIRATTSAIMWPRIISSIAAKCGKPGARIFRR